MSNRNWFEDDEVFEEVTQCQDCIMPNGCIRECVVDNYQHEEVAKIRGEIE
jgi:hypothetical protein